MDDPTRPNNSPSNPQQPLPPPSAAKNKRKRERNSFGGAFPNLSTSADSSNGGGIIEEGEEDGSGGFHGEDGLRVEERDQLLALLKMMDPTSSVLSFPLPRYSESDPLSLLAILSQPDPPAHASVQHCLDLISPSSVTLPSHVAPNEGSALIKSRQHRTFVEGVRKVLDGLGRGRKGKGKEIEPLRKIALFQKLSTFSQPPQGGGTFFTDAIETDDELLETGLAEVVEVHPTPETRPEDQPTLGQIGQLPARSEPRRKPLRSEDQPATIAPIFYPPSPFSSFAPTHDSTRATQTLSETARLVRRKLDLHHARHQLGSLRPSSSIDGDCQSRGGAVSTSEVTEGGVDALLEKNWARLRRLEELRSERTVKKQQTPSEEENIIARSLATSLTHLVSLRPSLHTAFSTSTSTSSSTSSAILPTHSQLASLRSLVSISNPPPAYRGTLEPSRPFALKDSTTMKVLHPHLINSNAGLLGRPGGLGQGQAQGQGQNQGQSQQQQQQQQGGPPRPQGFGTPQQSFSGPPLPQNGTPSGMRPSHPPHPQHPQQRPPYPSPQPSHPSQQPQPFSNRLPQPNGNQYRPPQNQQQHQQQQQWQAQQLGTPVMGGR